MKKLKSIKVISFVLIGGLASGGVSLTTTSCANEGVALPDFDVHQTEWSNITYGYTDTPSVQLSNTLVPPSDYTGRVTYSIVDNVPGNFLSISDSILSLNHNCNAGNFDYKIRATASADRKYSSKSFDFPGSISVEKANMSLGDVTIDNDTNDNPIMLDSGYSDTTYTLGVQDAPSNSSYTFSLSDITAISGTLPLLGDFDITNGTSPTFKIKSGIAVGSFSMKFNVNVTNSNYNDSSTNNVFDFYIQGQVSPILNPSTAQDGVDYHASSEKSSHKAVNLFTPSNDHGARYWDSNDGCVPDGTSNIRTLTTPIIIWVHLDNVHWINSYSVKPLFYQYLWNIYSWNIFGANTAETADQGGITLDTRQNYSWADNEPAIFNCNSGAGYWYFGIKINSVRRNESGTTTSAVVMERLTFYGY